MSHGRGNEAMLLIFLILLILPAAGFCGLQITLRRGIAKCQVSEFQKRAMSAARRPILFFVRSKAGRSLTVGFHRVLVQSTENTGLPVSLLASVTNALSLHGCPVALG
jgi:hypothetical protein